MLPFDLYTTSISAWQAMAEHIQKAKESIYIEMYIFSDNTGADYNFVDLLIERANSGLQIIMTLDAFGSYSLSKKTIDRLEKRGVEIVFFRHWLHRTHKKLIIIDGSIGFLGGVNIFNEARTWDDLQLKVEGIFAKKLIRSFAHSYKLSGGKQYLKSLPELEKEDNINTRDYEAWLLENTPISNRYKLRKYYKRKLSLAKKSIIIVTPYYTPAFWLEDILERAIKNGVEVKIVLPKITNHRLADESNHYYGARAVNFGAKVYFNLTKMNHGKAILLDGTEGLIGSSNMDFLSILFNSELGIFFRNKDLILKLKQAIDSWLACSHLYTQKTYKLKWYRYILVYIVKLFYKVI